MGYIVLTLIIAAGGILLYLNTLEDDLAELYCGIRKDKSDQDVKGSEKCYWPWQVVIMSRQNQSDQYHYSCGGAIISNIWILTAAACVDVDNNTLQNNMLILAGANRLVAQEYRQYSKIESVIVQKAYDPESNSNNIALVKLGQPLFFNDTVTNVCLPCRIRTNNKHIENCHVIRYQDTDGGLGLLKEEEVEMVSRKTCNNWYNYSITPDKQCAKRVDPESCKGQIGGPLSCFVPDEHRYFILGIRIHSRKCGFPDMPDIYLDVIHHYYWVKYYTGVE